MSRHRSAWLVPALAGIAGVPLAVHLASWWLAAASIALLAASVGLVLPCETSGRRPPARPGPRPHHPPLTVEEQARLQARGRLEGPAEIVARECPPPAVYRLYPIVWYPIVWSCGVPGCGGHSTKDGATFCHEIHEATS